MNRFLLPKLLALLLCAFPGSRAKAEEPQKEWKLKPALIVMDVQNDFMPMMSEQDQKIAPEVINAALRWFHENGLPVIRVYHTDPRRGPAPDSKGFEFPSNIAIKSDDPKVIKNHPSAFKKTDLEKQLRDRGVNTVFICGLSATGCALATWHGAQDMDFQAFMLKDGLLSPNRTQTEMIQDICPTISLHALALLLNSMAK